MDRRLAGNRADYIYASVAERNRRKQAHERIRYAVMAAISVLAIVAGFQWLQAERQRQSAEKNAALARAEEARTKQPWHLKQKSPGNCTNSCGKRAGQASTKPSVSSSWESGEKASLFWRARSSSTLKIQLLQNDSSTN